MIYLICDHHTERLKYTAQYIFQGTGFALLSPREPLPEKGQLVYYTNKPGQDGLHVAPAGLLFQKDIQEQDIKVKDNLGFPYFFSSPGELPFDVFSAVFFMLSRYEEYLPFRPDKFGRFPATESLAYKKGFHESPVVEIWVEYFKQKLQEKYPELVFKSSEYQFISTLDVDIAYAFKGRNMMGSLLHIANDMANLHKKRLQARLRTLFKNAPDPFDTYFYIERIHEQQGIEPLWFFQVGKRGNFDKNMRPGNKAYRELIKRLSEKYPVGVHPSYRSNQSGKRLAQEINSLQKIVGHDITRSRQHYLKVSFPETYARLAMAGIKEDYSMGFADQLGFRAGTCRPFYFYDLFQENQLDLTIYPLVAMDATMKLYLKLSPAVALQKLISLSHTIKKHGGIFMILWHNSSFSEFGGWQEWQDVYGQLLEECKR
jgi:hypothetical protein